MIPRILPASLSPISFSFCAFFNGLMDKCGGEILIVTLFGKLCRLP